MDDSAEKIGDYRIHDATIRDLIHNRESVEVQVKSVDGELIYIRFSGVKDVECKNCNGMILYSIVESLRENGARRFIFVNWDEESDSKLEITAEDYELSG